MRFGQRSRKSNSVVSARQGELLLLLSAVGGSVGLLDFQKLLFLYCQEQGADKLYDFVPYKFGAFSFTSYADRRKLVKRGFLAGDDQQWQLTDEGRRAMGGAPDTRHAAFAHRYSALRGDSLVAETYRRFPFYAIRSEIAQRVLRGDHAALDRVEAAGRIESTPGVVTIGYEGYSIESFLVALLRSGVTLLCDVRRNAISRKYGFSKATLSRGCEGVGIRYEHLSELGIDSERRRGLDSQADYDALFAEYERKSLPKQTQALRKIAEWVRGGERVALTCYENLPQRCHRHCVAEALTRRLKDHGRQMDL